jgi:hypothetical protein
MSEPGPERPVRDADDETFTYADDVPSGRSASHVASSGGDVSGPVEDEGPAYRRADMSAVVHTKVTREELEAKRREVIAGLGISIETLRHRATYESLSPDEWDAVSELRMIGAMLDDVDGDF